MQFSSLFCVSLAATGALAGNPRLHPRVKSANSVTATTDAAPTATADASGAPTDTAGVKPMNSTSTAAISGLDSKQSKNAQAIMQQIKKSDLNGQSNKACLAVFATALQESQLYIYANKAVPESMKIPHDKVGDDHDSVGIFQQRVTYYPNVEADMDPAKSVGQFLTKLKAVAGWETMETSALCQKIQVAEAGNLYGDNIPQAKKICSAGGIVDGASGTSKTQSGKTQKTKTAKTKGNKTQSATIPATTQTTTDATTEATQATQ